MSAAGLVAILAPAALLVAAPAAASTFEVTRTDDPVPGRCAPRDCSLREAAMAANRARGADVIELRSGATYRLERSGNADGGGDIDVSSGVTMRTSRRPVATIDGTGFGRVLEFKGPGESRLTRLLIKGGRDEAVRINERSSPDDPNATLHLRGSRVRRSEGLGISGYNSRFGVPGARVVLSRSSVSLNGAGISAQRVALERSRIYRNLQFGGVFACDRLRMRRTVVSGNAVEGDRAGGVQIGDDQNSDPDCIGYQFRILNSQIVANSSTEGSGGVDTGNAGGRGSIRGTRVGNNHGRETGGLNLAFADTFMRDSHVLSNTGIREAGGVTGSEVDIVESTVRRNTGESGGMNVFDLRMARTTVSENRAAGDGGGLAINRGSIVNSTIANNAADGSGGGILVSTYRGAGLASTTVAYNRANADESGGGKGGGIARAGTRAWPVRDALIALNTVGGSNADPQCSGSFAARGHSLLTSDDPGCIGLGGRGDLIRGEPRIGLLADNGGPTHTIALMRRSPAIGAAGRRKAPKIDQRRVPRDLRPDIGAFERR